MWTAYFSIFSSLIGWSLVRAQYLPDAKQNTVRELEHLFLDGTTTGMLSAVSPCSNYIDPATGKSDTSKGRTAAGQWIRVAFHDFVTANIYTQSGGLDASIGFETGRGENVGPAFADALTFFSYFFNKAVSMSDLIALGTVLATSSCGGPHVPFRGGRKDATSAGPTGVPEPETSLSSTLNQFSNAGLNTDDTIILTACGHSIGGVHKAQFPQVFTSNTTCTLQGSDGRCSFDSTPNGFDVGTVNDYVHSTGSKGGPLVTTGNVTVQSDLRLYQADQNQTIDRLSANGADYFTSQCAGIFQRMIETVPGGVALISPAIDPTSTTNLKPYGISLSIDWKGGLVLSGNFRYVQVSGAGTAPASLTIALIDRKGKTTKTSTTAQASGGDTGNGLFGPQKSYAFTLPYDAKDGLTGVTANGQTFSFQDNMFVVKSLSSVSPNPPAFAPAPSLNAVATYNANLTVAYYSTAPPPSLSATIAIPTVPSAGSYTPSIDTSTTADLKLIGKTSGYGIYSALISKSVSGKQAYGVSVDVAVPGQAAGVLGWRPFIAAQ